MRLIVHSRPTLSREEIRAVTRVLASGYITQGERVKSFEKAISSFVGARGAVATNSGTSALHLALLSLGTGPGREVLLPSYVCTAVLNAVSYTGASPRLFDTDPEDFNCDPADVKRKLSRRTSAVIVPHMFGRAARIGDILSFGVPVIEDCAHALGATYEGRRVGSLGDLAIFSFYATKVLATGEGGMVAGGSQRLLSRVRNLREFDEREDYIPRYNYKMTEVEAALGLVQLRKLPSFLRRRRKLAGCYDRMLAGSRLELPASDGERPHTYYRYVVKVPGSARRLSERLVRRGVQAKPPVFRPLHRYLGLDSRRFPGAEEVARRALSLPIYPSLAEEEARKVAETVLDLVS